MEEGCWAGGGVLSSAPNVKKLSYCRSGKNPKNKGLMPRAKGDALSSELNHPKESVVFRINGLLTSPEHALR
jgi:hypothetical protein